MKERKVSFMEKSKKELLTRVISSLVGFPLVLIIFIFANDIVFSVAVTILSLICLYEYYNGFKVNKKANPSSWCGYFVTILLLFLDIIGLKCGLYMSAVVALFAFWILIFMIVVLTLEMILTSGKKTINDMAITIFGIIYITVMFFFLNLIRRLNMGKVYIWYAIIPAWGSDIFAYLIGRKLGKHKLTKISPNKTIEGSLAGIISAIIIGLIYTLIINNVFALHIKYLQIAFYMGIFAIIGQIGDLAESAIKRYCDIKDFSELIPGHGGMLDRFDSVIFILPHAYTILSFLIFW